MLTSEAYTQVYYPAGTNLIQVTYASGDVVTLDLFEDFSETSFNTDAEVENELRHSAIHPGSSIAFPRTLNAQTSPNLWAAREWGVAVLNDKMMMMEMAAALQVVAGVASASIAPGPSLRTRGYVGTVGRGGTYTFYRGMTYGEALEAVENQGLNEKRIQANQALNPPASGPGAYLTSQEGTAMYYGDLAGGNGRGLGPAVVRIEVPADEFERWAAARGINLETPIPRGPSPDATETLIPFEYLDEFNNMARFFLHD